MPGDREEALGEPRQEERREPLHRRRAVAEQRDRDAVGATQQHQRPVLLAEIADQPVRLRVADDAPDGGIAARIERIAESSRMAAHAAVGQAVPDQRIGAQHGIHLVAVRHQPLGKRHEMRGRAGVFRVGTDKQEFHDPRSS
jgi:hypothetical protein